MFRLIGKRLLLTVPMLLGMSIIVFGLLRLVPGDPASSILGAYATPAQLAQVREQLGLNRSIVVQYTTWLGDVIHGDLGVDYTTGQPIRTVLADRLPVTVEVVLLAFLLAIVVGIPTGVWSAVRRGKIADKSIQGVAVLGIAVPNFWIGIVLILAFSLTLRVFPSSGFVAFSVSPWQNLRSVILPAVSLAAGLSAVLMRITRGAMIDALNLDHITFSRAKGVPERRVVWRHALRSAAIPIVTVAGLQAGYLLGSTIVIEQVFSLPGVGQLIIQSMLNQNYPEVQGAILVIAFTFIIVNLLVDLSYPLISPKLRAGGREI